MIQDRSWRRRGALAASNTLRTIGAALALIAAGQWTYAVAAAYNDQQAPLGERVAVSAAANTPVQRFPRVVAFPTQAVMQRANAILAQREKRDAVDRADCLAHHRPPPADPANLTEFNETIRTSYLSAVLLSVEVRRDYMCAAYPNLNVAMPITIDMRTGQQLAWETVFKPGFIQTDGPNSLKALYLQRYAVGKRDPDCVTEIRGWDEVALWLRSSTRSLTVQPQLIHAVRACSDDIEIPLREVVPFIRDASIAREFRRLATAPVSRVPGGRG